MSTPADDDSADDRAPAEDQVAPQPVVAGSVEEPGPGAAPPTTPPASPEQGRKPEDKPKKERGGSFLREVPILVAIALVIAILIKTFLVQAFYIPSGSMEPTLTPGDRVLVNKVVYRIGDIHRGDVIVFQNPDQARLPKRSWFGAVLHWLGEGLGFAQPEDEDLIKRVIGLPGDTVQARGGRVYVNGKKLDEPYLPPDTSTVMSRAYRVPPNDLFVLGDNRGNSADSRFFGFVPTGKVIGKAFVVIWPPSDLGGLG